jgi:primosomal protein N' (replication factor Y) (superfamily II helicase)
MTKVAAVECEVSLPVPLDQTFSYLVPASMVEQVLRGSRVLVPFGQRQLAGVVMGVQPHDGEAKRRSVLRVLDAEAVFDEKLLELGAWIASYYCASAGEVYRVMAPLAGEIRKQLNFELTDAGRQLARQESILPLGSEDVAALVLRLLEQRGMSAAALEHKVPGAKAVLSELRRKGFLRAEEAAAEKDPLRAPANKLLVEWRGEPDAAKLPKAERELLAYLHLHPGAHRLSDVAELVKNASTAARALARRGVVELRLALSGVNESFFRPEHALNTSQLAAAEEVKKALELNRFQSFLLLGVTGSGKTEVYLRCMQEALALGKSAMLLVPEIGLTPAAAAQFVQRFGDKVAILHSAFSDAERAAQWRRIRRGEAQVVVGTRSAVFAPMHELGLILVDEEHDHSYKQGETPRYNGRDVAVKRAHQLGAVVVLGSATPSLETRHNAEQGRYAFLQLPERIEQRPMPEVEIVDMRLEFLEAKRNALFSRRLLEMMQQRLAAKEQCMLLMNRRGFSSVVCCRSCGHRVECQNCAVSLTWHKQDKRLLCHYCGYAERVPELCPQCGSEHVYFLGSGAEKVEHELAAAFPDARVARMDRDTVTTKQHFESILQGFRDHDYDILVGTQMIAKGHDIPRVTLVGILSADTGLGMPDFRAAERSFQLLTQAAGRAGRGELAGSVVIQTMNPEHYAIRFAAAQDYGQFYEKELEFRRTMRYPPFSALANVVVRHEKQEMAMRMAGELKQLVDPAPTGLRVQGPAEAAMVRLKNEFRYQMLMKSASRKLLAEHLQRMREWGREQKWSPTALVIDVDPMSLL